MRDKKILIMAGGTGGHVYPALATANLLQEQHDRIEWMGSKGGMEEEVVTKAGIPFHGISVQGLRGKGKLSLALAPFKIVHAVLQAISVIRKVKPDCVMGMGGFASGPGGLAARLLGKPLLIHEQNAVAGMTNRVLSKVANSVMEAFPDSFPGQVAAKLTGNPLRKDVCELYYQPKETDQSDRPMRLLVLGGSLGALRLNECVPQALGKLNVSDQPEIWHQSGKRHFDVTEQAYKASDVEAKVSPYIDDMAAAYKWADFVICRAGALTISELCAAGLGAILVPYPHAVDDHQTLNARWMEKAGAAWLLPQQDLNAETLAEMLKPLITKRKRIAILSEAAHKLGQPEATEKVAAECRRLCYV